MKNRIFTALTGFFVAILIITVSIGLPIYVRQFYYYQIDALNIEAYSGADCANVKSEIFSSTTR